MRFFGVLDFIRKNDNFILTAHESPDGDAVGSEIALYLGLSKLGKKVRILNTDQLSRKYQFLNYNSAFETPESEDDLPEDIQNWVLIILDTNDIHNIGRIEEMVLPRVRSYMIIDHHERNKDIIKHFLIEKNASSTCEVLYDLFESLKLPLDKEMATALYVGIVYDTGSFIYPKTTAKTLYIAHKLVNLGVVPNDIYVKIYESNSISSLVLQSKVLSSLEMQYDNHVAIQTMLKETIEECNAVYEEADTLINAPLKSENIKVSIFFKENEEGVLRCSLRSKGNINVADIAKKFGGGGHLTAAGFKCRAPLDETKEKVLKMLSIYFK